MKYLLLIYNNPEAMAALPEAEVQAIYARVDAVLDSLRASGELVGGDGLAPPSTAKLVRRRDGAVAVTDGPFAESKEYIAGFYVIEADDLDSALDIARRNPINGQGGGVEVRPIEGGFIAR